MSAHYRQHCFDCVGKLNACLPSCTCSTLHRHSSKGEAYVCAETHCCCLCRLQSEDEARGELQVHLQADGDHIRTQPPSASELGTGWTTEDAVYKLPAKGGPAPPLLAKGPSSPRLVGQVLFPLAAEGPSDLLLKRTPPRVPVRKPAAPPPARGPSLPVAVGSPSYRLRARRPIPRQPAGRAPLPPTAAGRGKSDPMGRSLPKAAGRGVLDSSNRSALQPHAADKKKSGYFGRPASSATAEDSVELAFVENPAFPLTATGEKEPDYSNADEVGSKAHRSLTSQNFRSCCNSA